MADQMVLRIWDVEHGACAMLHPLTNGVAGRLAMIDSGHKADWRPSTFIRHDLRRTQLDYLIVTNADQDHLSDLEGLWLEGVNVVSLHRNPNPSPDVLRRMKLQSGPLTDDIARFIDIHSTYIYPIAFPFNQSMNGITMSVFHNSYPEFTDTNNLSLVVFVKYANFKILFPGDLEAEGWRALLRDPTFCLELVGTNILVASHHGRRNGFCEDIFNFFTPDAVVISDKPIAHQTQLTLPDYRRVVNNDGVPVATTLRRRHVLTTRRDGHITFIVDGDGTYYRIDTERRR